MSAIHMKGVREYAEEMLVFLDIQQPWEDENDPRIETGRTVVWAANEGGHNSTSVDLSDLLRWLANNMPEVLIGALRRKK